MQRFLVIIAAGLVPVSGLAQESDWNQAQQVEVTLSSFAFAPETIRLTSGRPVILHLVNASGGGHNFSAPDFFSASTIRDQDKALLKNGAVEVRGHEARDIAVVPRAGHYHLRCSHSLHSTFGMEGEIIVEQAGSNPG